MSTTSVSRSTHRLGIGATMRPRVLRVRLMLMGFGAIAAGAVVGAGIDYWPVIL